MKRLIALVPVVLFLVLASGGLAAQSTGTRVGMMSVDGKNAFLNRRRVDAREPVPVYDGDYVSTGERTSVRIGLVADGYGGFIQLDENTDPNLVIASACIVVNILKGQALVNAKNICLRTRGISGVTRSVVNLKADDAGTVVTVIEGQMQVEQPTATTVAGSERLVVLPDGTYHQYAITPAEASRSIEWAQRYFTQPPATGRHLPKWLLPLGAAILIGGAIHEHGDDDRDDDDRDDGRESANEGNQQAFWCCLRMDGDGGLVPTHTTREQCARNEASIHATRDEALRACPPQATSDAPGGTQDGPPVPPESPPPPDEPPPVR